MSPARGRSLGGTPQHEGRPGESEGTAIARLGRAVTCHTPSMLEPRRPRSRKMPGGCWSTLALSFLLLAVVAPSAGAQTSSCLETGLGLYPGWHGFSYSERARRCLEAEQRARERLDRIQERDAVRELRREQII